VRVCKCSAGGAGFITALQVLDAGRIGIAALAVDSRRGSTKRRAGTAFGAQAVRQRLPLPEHPREAGGQRDRIRAAPAQYRAASMNTQAGGPRSSDNGEAVLE